MEFQQAYGYPGKRKTFLPALKLKVKRHKLKCNGSQFETITFIEYASRAKIIFAGKLRNPYFCHIFGMEMQFFF